MIRSHQNTILFLFTLLIFISCNAGSEKEQAANKMQVTVNKSTLIRNSLDCPDKPHMWEPMDIGKARRDSFLAVKHVKLSNLIGKEETKELFFNDTAFAEMITYFDTAFRFTFLDLHIANYEGGTEVPEGYENKLTVLFIPKSGNTFKGFFSIPPGAKHFDPKSSLFNINGTTALRWIRSYKRKGKGKMGELLNTIDYNTSENRSANEDPGQDFDTKRVRYSSCNIEELVMEMSYQRNYNNVEVNGIVIQFAAYGMFGRETNDNDHGKYKKRLLMQFELTKHSHVKPYEIFYIDTTGNPSCKFNERGDPRPCYQHLDGQHEIKSLDKGQLCPANCPN